MTDKYTNIVTIASNRKMSFAQYGDPGGRPVLFFHGFYSSRVSALSAHVVAKSLGIRLLALDRPGIGLSTHVPNRKILDWPKDIEIFAKKLKLRQFSILGYSAGAAYALSCAYKIPSLINQVGIVSPLPPMDGKEVQQYVPLQYKILKKICSNTPFLLYAFFSFLRNQIMVSPDNLVDKGLIPFPKEDIEILHTPAIRKTLASNLLETFRQGIHGTLSEINIFTENWNFPLHSVDAPIKIWHGVKDTTLPIQYSSYLKKLIPHAIFYPYDKGGHFFLFNYWSNIFREIL